MKKGILGLGLVIIVFYSFINQNQAQRTCGTDEYVEQLIQQDKEYARKLQRLRAMKKIADRAKSGVACSSPVIVPVAIHYNDPVTCDDPVCLLTIAEAQLQVLNDEFAAANADYQEYLDLSAACPSEYPLSRAPVQFDGTCIQFCLARTDHPPCSGLSDGDPAITVGQHDWSFASGWAGYLNIFVSGSQGGLGVSVLAGDADGDGFWCTYTAFGAPGVSCTSGVTLNTSVIYGLGRTATHEAGHYFGLPHVFGNCGDSDSNPPGPVAINDTPAQDDPFYGDPIINDCSDVIYQCTDNPISYWSFMDYSDDSGYIMFSADQSDVINWHGNDIPFKSDVTACAGNYGPIVCQNTDPETCADGVQNQDEQSIDCGGTVCGPCPSICGADFYDEAGPCSAYGDLSLETWTFCPDNTNEILIVTFSLFEIETDGPNDCYDFLEVYDGSDTGAPQIGGEFCGDSVQDAPGGGSVAASVPGGCLTFLFDSDPFVVREGWEAEIFCTATVPLELTNFIAEHRQSFNYLQWETAFELQNKGFEVLRSLDGKDFESIAFLPGLNEAHGRGEYQFEDHQIEKDQRYYYQLRQIDNDGQYYFSEIRTIYVRGERQAALKLYPNPVSASFLYIEISEWQDQEMSYEILNMQGSLIQKGLLSEALNLVEIEDLTRGVYIFRISKENIPYSTQKLIRF